MSEDKSKMDEIHESANVGTRNEQITVQYRISDVEVPEDTDWNEKRSC